MAFIDNGDGTITTEEGIRIAKPYSARKAADYAIPGHSGMYDRFAATQDALAEWQKEQDAYQRPASLEAAPGFAINPELLAAAAPPPDMRTASAEDIIRGALAPKGPGTLTLPDQDMTPDVPREPPKPKGDADKIAAALGVPETLPKGLKPADRTKLEEEGETVAPEDRVQVGGGGPAFGGGPGFGAPRVIDKGGMKPVMQQIQKGTELPKELKDQFDENLLTHRAANEATRLASEQENAQTSGAASQYATDAERKLAEEQARMDRHRTVMQDATSKLDAMATEYREKPINQDSYWEEKGAGARIMSGLFVAMDEITSMKTGRQGGTVASIIDKQINDWIADKKERREGAYRHQQGVVSRIQDQFQSESAQNAALRAQAYDAYRAKLSSITANSQSEKEKAAALQLDGDLADKALDWKTKAAQLEADHVTVQEKMVGPTVVGGAPKVGALERSLVVQDMNGRKYLARDIESARDLNSKHALTKVAVDAANTMARISNQSAGQKLDPNSTAGKEFGFAQEQFLNSMNTLAGQGVVRSEDIERYQNYTGGKFGLSTAEAAKKLGSKAQTAYSYSLSAKADTESELAEDFQQNPKTGTIEKVPHYRMFSGGGGKQVPIAFSAVGKGKRKKH